MTRLVPNFEMIFALIRLETMVPREIMTVTKLPKEMGMLKSE